MFFCSFFHSAFVFGSCEIKFPTPGARDRTSAVGTTDQAPDLYLTASPGYAFWAGQDGPLTQDVNPVAGSHSYRNTDPEMQALFVSSGSHIRAGINLGTISNLRVAPTIAKLLGVFAACGQRAASR